MSRLVLISTVFLALWAAAAADVAFGGGDVEAPPSSQWTAVAAEDGEYTECDGLPAGQRVCADECGKVLLCMGGSLDPIVLEECKADLKCNAQQGECVNGTSSCDAVNTTITCHGLGMFPDPYDCTGYHICCSEDGDSVRVPCESGYAYDPSTTLCSKKLTDDVCTNLPIECDTLGKADAFPGNANIFYICVDPGDGPLYPELYRCEHGGTYNPDTYSCEDSSS